MPPPSATQLRKEIKKGEKEIAAKLAAKEAARQEAIDRKRDEMKRRAERDPGFNVDSRMTAHYRQRRKDRRTWEIEAECAKVALSRSLLQDAYGITGLEYEERRKLDGVVERKGRFLHQRAREAMSHFEDKQVGPPGNVTERERAAYRQRACKARGEKKHQLDLQVQAKLSEFVKETLFDLLQTHEAAGKHFQKRRLYRTHSDSLPRDKQRLSENYEQPAQLPTPTASTAPPSTPAGGRSPARLPLFSPAPSQLTEDDEVIPTEPVIDLTLSDTEFDSDQPLAKLPRKGRASCRRLVRSPSSSPEVPSTVTRSSSQESAPAPACEAEPSVGGETSMGKNHRARKRKRETPLPENQPTDVPGSRQPEDINASAAGPERDSRDASTTMPTPTAPSTVSAAQQPSIAPSTAIADAERHSLFTRVIAQARMLATLAGPQTLEGVKALISEAKSLFESGTSGEQRDAFIELVEYAKLFASDPGQKHDLRTLEQEFRKLL